MLKNLIPTKKTKEEAKIITNGDDSLKSSVRAELIDVISKSKEAKIRMEYILAAHQEKLIPSDLIINKGG